MTEQRRFIICADKSLTTCTLQDIIQYELRELKHKTLVITKDDFKDEKQIDLIKKCIPKLINDTDIEILTIFTNFNITTEPLAAKLKRLFTKYNFKIRKYYYYCLDNDRLLTNLKSELNLQLDEKQKKYYRLDPLKNKLVFKPLQENTTIPNDLKDKQLEITDEKFNLLNLYLDIN